MRKSRFTDAQIIGIIEEQEAGLLTGELCRKHGLSPATFYKLKAKYGGMDLSDSKRLKQLKEENAKLKRLMADVMLDHALRRHWFEPNGEGLADDADATAGPGAAGDEGSSDLSAPGLRPDRYRSQNRPARASAR